MRLTVRVPAGSGRLFALHAAEEFRGQKMPVRAEHVPVGEGVILDAEVVEGGAAMICTIEMQTSAVTARLAEMLGSDEVDAYSLGE